MQDQALASVTTIDYDEAALKRVEEAEWAKKQGMTAGSNRGWGPEKLPTKGKAGRAAAKARRQAARHLGRHDGKSR